MTKRNDDLKFENNTAHKKIYESQNSSGSFDKISLGNPTRSPMSKFHNFSSFFFKEINFSNFKESSVNVPDLADFAHHFHSSSTTLEATEVDYLRQIIYAYMMGTDPLVTTAVFK